MNITCPYCDSKNQEVEPLRRTPDYWLSGTCDNCERDFSYDSRADLFFDDDGTELPRFKKIDLEETDFIAEQAWENTQENNLDNS